MPFSDNALTRGSLNAGPSNWWPPVFHFPFFQQRRSFRACVFQRSAWQLSALSLNLSLLSNNVIYQCFHRLRCVTLSTRHVEVLHDKQFKNTPGWDWSGTAGADWNPLVSLRIYVSTRGHLATSCQWVARAAWLYNGAVPIGGPSSLTTHWCLAGLGCEEVTLRGIKFKYLLAAALPTTDGSLNVLVGKCSS